MNTPYFFFTLNQHLSAIKTDYMEEVFSLPELILIPNAPLGIVGVIDLRGEVLPILDLQLIADSRPEPYQLTDSVVVVSHAELRIGIVAKSIQGLRDVSSEDINTDLSQYQEQLSPEVRRFISGQGVAEEPFFVLSEPQNWFSSGEIQQVISVTSFLVNEIYSSSRVDATQYGVEAFEPNNSIGQTKSPQKLTLEAQTIFRQRAESLRRSLDEDASMEGSNTFVIVSLNNKFFGIESQIVREFITVTEATPIPCCPNHIIGNINLRGEILTIIDIGKALDLELNSLAIKPKAIVAELDNMTIGIVVEDIQDAMFTINPKSIQGISDPALALKRAHIRGAVPYQHQMMHILDLSALLKSEELVVNERV
ncbi:MAG: chemotaxis protein CheW [Cyanobacteria bacterium J06636_16]